MSKPQADLCRLLQVHHIKTLVYHPQMDGLVIALQPITETDAEASGSDWDLFLPYVLFATRPMKGLQTVWNFRLGIENQILLVLGATCKFLARWQGCTLLWRKWNQSIIACNSPVSATPPRRTT